jgi:hypothetical protein
VLQQSHPHDRAGAGRLACRVIDPLAALASGRVRDYVGELGPGGRHLTWNAVDSRHSLGRRGGRPSDDLVRWRRPADKPPVPSVGQDFMSRV